MTEYKLFAQRVGLVGITNLIFSLRGLIPILTKTLGAENISEYIGEDDKRSKELRSIQCQTKNHI